MQIVCEYCGHTGEAASVTVEDGAVVVTCAACGASNTLGTSGAAPPAASAAVDEPVAKSAPEAIPVAAAAATDSPKEVGPVAVDAQRTVDGPGGRDFELAYGLDDAPSAPSRAVPVAELPPVKCPKCGHRQHDEYACHKCGLVFELAAKKGERPWERVPDGKHAQAKRAEELWDRVEAVPDARSRHDDFVEYCLEHQLVELAARKYRHRVADYPGESLSRESLDRIVQRAQAMVESMATGVPGNDALVKGAATAKRVMLVVVAVLLILATIYVFRAFQTGPADGL